MGVKSKTLMKKISVLISIFVILTAFKCENEPLEGDFQNNNDTNENCETAIQNTTVAATAFEEVTEANFTQLCVAYKAALQAQILECGDSDGSLQTTSNALGDCTFENSFSIVGIWKIISLTSNGDDVLEEELDHAGICFWHELYTETTLTEIDFSGDDCTDQTVDETLPYTLEGSTLSYTTGDEVLVSLEVMEISATTLILKDLYNEEGTDYIDIYTYDRQ